MHFCRFTSTLDSLKRVFKVQWNPVNTVTNEPKKFGRIQPGGGGVLTRVFWEENVGRYLRGGQKKKGRNNEVTALLRWP